MRQSGDNGFLFANGGFATDNHCIILSRQPLATASFPQDYGYQAEADAKRGMVPDLDQDYSGPATIESFTIFYDRGGAPKSGVVVARGSQNQRTLAFIDVGDADLLAFFTSGAIEPVGQPGLIRADADKGHFWHRG